MSCSIASVCGVISCHGSYPSNSTCRYKFGTSSIRVSGQCQAYAPHPVVAGRRMAGSKGSLPGGRDRAHFACLSQHPGPGCIGDLLQAACGLGHGQGHFAGSCKQPATAAPGHAAEAQGGVTGALLDTPLLTIPISLGLVHWTGSQNVWPGPAMCMRT